jgi:hypothetical protein
VTAGATNDVGEQGDVLFSSFVDASELLRGLWRKCSESPAVAPETVVFSTNFRRYTSGAILELSVDCEARAGKAFAWCLDIRKRDSGWVVARSVRVNDDDGQHQLIKFSDSEFPSTRTLADQLMRLVDELVSTFDRVNLSS